MSGLEPTSQRNEEEVLERMLKDRSILELEDRLGIKIPTSKDQSEEDLINRILEMTGRPISKRGDEFVYAPTRPNFGRDDGLSFYVNPKINGAGIRYSKNFADGGIASFADGGSLNRKDGGIVKLQEGGEPDTIFEPDLIKYSDEGPLSFRDVSDLIFDPTDPVDYAVLALMATGVGAPAAIAIKLARAGVKGTKLINTMNKVEKVNKFKKVEKPRDILTNTAKLGAANYLTDEMNPVSYEKMDVLLSDKIRNDPNYQDLMMSDQDAMIPKSIDLLNRPEEKADGGIAGFAEGGRVGKVAKVFTKVKDKFKKKKDKKKETSSGEKINEKIKEIKTTDPKTTTAIKEGTAPEKTLIQKAMPYASLNVFNPATKARKTKGALISASTLPAFFRDEDKDNVESGQDFTISNPITDDSIFESDTGGSIPDTNPSDWSNIMKARLVNDQGFELDDKGEFIDKPKFRNYLRSLPKSYMDKVGADKDFAKKMMAGFLNMMKPVEGFVPVNPFVAFGEGYLGEESRQAKMLPADVQTLKFLQDNPKLAKLYKENLQAEAGVLLSDVKAEDASGYYNLLIGDLARKQNVSIDQIASGNYELYYGDTPVGEPFILGQMGKGVNVLADSNYSLKEVE